MRHSRNRRAALVGLALLATDYDERDVPLIQTIGLLSRDFGPLAAVALRRRQGGTDALTWLGDRTTGWGRVEVVEALCHHASVASGSLLRHACDGHFLNGYFAGKVATTAHLHSAITSENPDEELIGHTGRLLHAMTWCQGMG